MPPPSAPSSPVDRVVRHRRVDVGDVVLHVVEAGPPDGHLVLLLHGFPEDWRSWRHQVPALAVAGYRVAAADLRGYGASDRPARVAAYRAVALAGDVAGLVEGLGATRATVVGHDWGGVAAYAAALRHPEVVQRLVVLNAPFPDPSLPGLRSRRQALRFAYAAVFQLPWLPERLLAAGGGAGVRALLRAAATRADAFSAEDLAYTARRFRSPADLRGPLAYYRATGRDLVRRRGVVAAVGTVIRAPTTVVWGTADAVLPVTLADPGRARVPDLRLVLIPGAGHFVQSDAPHRVTTELLAALARPCPAPGHPPS